MMKDRIEMLEEILEVGTIENVTSRFKNRKPNIYSEMDMDLCLRAEKGETLYEFAPNVHPSGIDALISSLPLHEVIRHVWAILNQFKQTQQ